LFQPAEETGSGAAAVISEQWFRDLNPDCVFALHNMPGYPEGQLIIGDGVFCCASTGVEIRLRGSEAHAAQPETGVNPAECMCRIVTEIQRLGDLEQFRSELCFATVVGARLGVGAYGTAPGEAEIRATLRATRDETMNELKARTAELTAFNAGIDGIEAELQFVEDFPTTVNSPRANDVVRLAGRDREIVEPETPMPWSEDFGRFATVADISFFGLGAGMETPPLHDASYDFPDELIDPSAKLMRNVLDSCIAEFGNSDRR
jgi:metal-dependent amidase/aminoacylase/carboxypeptidase family protein